jgi:hypothetical protein
VEALKNYLLDTANIPENHIKIATGDQKELDNINVFSRDEPTRYIVSVHKVGYFADRPCIFSPKGCENAVFKVVCP